MKQLYITGILTFTQLSLLLSFLVLYPLLRLEWLFYVPWVAFILGVIAFLNLVFLMFTILTLQSMRKANGDYHD